MKMKNAVMIFLGLASVLAYGTVVAGVHPPIDNPYGLDALWAQGDLVSRATLVILAVMSSMSWFIIFTKFLEQRRLLSQGRKTEKFFWVAETFDKGIEGLKANNVYRFIALTGKGAQTHHNAALAEKVDLSTWISTSIGRGVERLQNKLQDGLAFLATVGSTAPFIGLFGTVWGIYHALTAIGVAGQASIDKVAGPVGEALIMTAVGLAVATPAAIGYNMLLRRNKRIMEEAKLFGSDLHTMLLRGAMPGPSRKRDF